MPATGKFKVRPKCKFEAVVVRKEDGEAARREEAGDLVVRFMVRHVMATRTESNLKKTG